jgi:myo-inositol 2-dehydrogenase / D-chiro-inositol 1-dehydrogenase
MPANRRGRDVTIGEPRALIIGAGRMGAEHARSIFESGRFGGGLIVVDPDPNARERLAAQGAQAVPELDDVDFANVQLAVVSAPTRHHVGIVHDISERQIRCLVEKPCGLRNADFRELLSVEQRAAAEFRVGLWRRFSEPFTAVRDLIGQGAIGVPRAVLACQWDAEIPNLATQSVATTGGIGLDCGVHETDTIAWLGLGRVEDLALQTPATLSTSVAPGDIDQMLAQGRSDRGVALSVALSRTAGGVDEIFYKIIGDAGSVELRLGEEARVDLRQPGSVRGFAFGSDYVARALSRQLEALTGPAISADSARFVDAAAAAEPWLNDGATN